MKQVDYIIVGLGIAGIAFCERLEQLGRSYLVFDSHKPNATSVAGGVVNPVVLKRLSLVWNALEFVETAIPFYKELETRLNTSFLREYKLLRILTNAGEQNDWIVSSDSPELAPFLESEITPNTNPNINAPYGYGEVKNAFRIDTGGLLKVYRDYLSERGNSINEEFQYPLLNMMSDGIEYGKYKARHLVFTEGSSVIDNPYFSLDCLIPKKGEYITIRSADLQTKAILKGPFFVIPVGEDLYQVGATFAHGDSSMENTAEGRQQLMKAIPKMISCSFEVVDQTHGMRPTVKDRRPLLGSIGHDSVYFFNGLGTRGLLMAPLLSQWLVDHIENNTSLPSEVNITRFED